MRVLSFIAFCCALPALATTVLDDGDRLEQRLSCVVPAPGQGAGRLYYYVPRTVDLARKTGLFVFLHGGGSNSPDDAPENYLAKEDGQLRPHIDALGYVVAAASAPRSETPYRWNENGAEKAVLAIIEDAAKRFDLDRDRIVLGGQSMGGYGAYHLATVLADHFAAAWISCGAWKENDFRAFCGTPLYLQQGRWDCAAKYSNGARPRGYSWTGPCYAQAADELLTRDGVEHVLDLHEGGHALDWEPAQLATRRFVEWARTKRRNPFPDRTVLVTRCGSGLMPYLVESPRQRWLEAIETTDGEINVDRIETEGPVHAWTLDQFLAQKYRLAFARRRGARIDARNLGGNRFSVFTENVKRFRILLAPQMGDLERPFAVEGVGGTVTLKAQPLKGDPDYSAYLEVSVDPTFSRYRFADGADIPLLYYDAYRPVEDGSAAEVAVVLIHGWGGHVRTLLPAFVQALYRRAGAAAGTPYVIAPQFPRRETIRRNGESEDGRAVWCDSWSHESRWADRPGSASDDWRGGGDADDTSFSSFDYVDRIFARLADKTRYPNLKRVVLAGFSAGGQFAGRYAAVGKGKVRDGVTLAYVALSPSTQLLFDPDVPWHYGLKGRPRYSATLTENEILENLSTRRVWYGCGGEDVLGRPHTSLDMTSPAVAQGENRLKRFLRFKKSLEAYPEWLRQSSFHVFTGVGHKEDLCYPDPCLLDFILDKSVWCDRSLHEKGSN